jgi:hypothetical protein
MNTPADTRHRTATTDRPPEAARDRPPATRRYTTAAIVALGAVLLAAVWAAVALWPLSGQVDDLTRTDIPGEAVVTVDEPDGQVIYYERATWFASVPMNPDLAIDVTGPDGQTVPADPYGLAVHYRLPGLVGEPVATFDATVPGDYTVTVQDAEPLPDDARTAVGPSITTGVLTGLAGPIIVLLAGLVVAAVIAVLAATARSQPAGPR